MRPNTMKYVSLVILVIFLVLLHSTTTDAFPISSRRVVPTGATKSSDHRLFAQPKHHPNHGDYLKDPVNESKSCDSRVSLSLSGLNLLSATSRRTTWAILISTIGIGFFYPFTSVRAIAPVETENDLIINSSVTHEIQTTVAGDAGKLFKEARALESQGNIAAAQRLYLKVTKMAPRFIYGWSNLGNTQVVLGDGDLSDADQSYTTAIDLCQTKNFMINQKTDASSDQRKCNDLYVLLLNRGCVRLNNGLPKEALRDLQQASALRAQPDAVIAQNLARAKEMNGLFSQADHDYSLAISMTANEVNPFWLRSAMVKYELDDIQGGFDLIQRVNVRFPDAPEVRAAYAVFLAARANPIDDTTAAQQKFLEIPDKQRLRYSDSEYLAKVVAWPPAMRTSIRKLARLVGDDQRTLK